MIAEAVLAAKVFPSLLLGQNKLDEKLALASLWPTVFPIGDLEALKSVKKMSPESEQLMTKDEFVGWAETFD